MALALYRKYRPARLAEVVGQEHVTDPLATALTAGRINHAYLFSGPRGCGKTSSARILARSLNCVQGPTPDPCGECESCIALAPEGPGSIDVVELDAASHGGVEDARELRDRAFYAPAESRYRVFIVDEAHMVTTQGFNALLKIVEEPPDHLVFVFATTEPDKVLPTIRSRTHHYPFRLIPPGTMRSLLERICDDEDVTVAPPVYPLVIRAGGGSARDTLSVLDQLLAGAGPEGVTYERAVALLGVTDAALIDDTVDALAAGDGAAVYQAVDRLVEAGHDPRRFAADLLQRLRDLMLVQAVPDAAARGLVDGAEDELERMTDQAARLGPATLARYGEIVHNGLIEMRGATAPRLLLELLCARMLLPAATTSDPGLLERLERIERRNAIAPDARPDEDGGRQQFVRPSRRGDGGSAEPVASGAPEASVPQRPAPRERPAESHEPSSSDGSTGAGPTGSGRATSPASGAATPADAPAPSGQAPAPKRPGAGSGEDARSRTSSRPDPAEGRQASPGRSAGQQVSERLAAGAGPETGGASASGESADTPSTPVAGDAAAAPATTNASADPGVADASDGPATAGMSAGPAVTDASAGATTAGEAAEYSPADAPAGAATAGVSAVPADAGARAGATTTDLSAEPAPADAPAETTTADLSAEPAPADAAGGAAAGISAEPAAADPRAAAAEVSAEPVAADSDAGAGTAELSAEPAAADARARTGTADASGEPAAADARAGAASADVSAGPAAADARAGAAADVSSADPAAADAPAGAAATDSPAGAAAGEASLGGAATNLPAGSAATDAVAGSAAAEMPADGAATDASAGSAAAEMPADGAATDTSAVSAVNDPSATDAAASGQSDAPAASASAGAPTASAAPAGPPSADAPRPPRDGAPPDAAPPESARPAPSPASLDAAAVRRVWSEILAAARQRSRSTEALLVNATVRAVDGDTLVLTIGSPPLARRLSEPRNTDVIADALHAVLGVRWTVRCDQGDGPAPSRQANARPESRTRQAPTRPSARDAGLPDPATARPSRGEGEAGPSSSRPAQTDRTEGPGDPAPGAADRSRSGNRGNGRAAPDGGEPLPPEPPPEDAPPDVDDEESMMAEAAADTAPAGARRDPEVAAMELLSNELGARTIDRG